MRFHKLNFLGRTKNSTVFILTGTGLAFQAVNNSDFLPFSQLSPQVFPTFPEKIRFGIDGVVRSARAVSTIAFTVADYKYSLYGLLVGSEDYRKKLSEVHLRSAKRVLKLCETNKGFYVKAGQFVVAMRQVPTEYTSTLSSLQDQTVPFPFKAIKEVLISNLGKNFSEIFLSFDEEPIAAASIAQVHRAVLMDRQEVAIKVQYPGLEQKMKLDTTIMYFLSRFVAKFFPEYRFGWLVTEFVGRISTELNFIEEAENSERTAENFKHKKTVKVPRVFWDLTTSHVLTMQFCKGHKVDDVEYLKKMNINPVKVAKVLMEVFAEMIFIHGFIHGDPHPGNILVAPQDKGGFSLVLLDHGICKVLDEGFRLDYCRLWEALILLDHKTILDLGERFGVGEHVKFLPLIFTGRTFDSKSRLGKGMSDIEKHKMKEELKLLSMEDVSSFMESLPPDFLSVLRTDGMLRSIISKLNAPQRLRLLTYAKYSLYGLSPRPSPQSDFEGKLVLSRTRIYITYLRLLLVLELEGIYDGMKMMKQSLHNLYRRWSSSSKTSLGHVLSFPYWFCKFIRICD